MICGCASQTGLSLAEIADVIAVREGGAAPCPHVRALAESKIEEIDARIAELQRLRADRVRVAEVAREAETACAQGSSICIAFEETIELRP